MDYQEMLDRMQDKGSFKTQAEAENTLEVVLETLSERINRTERDDLAAQLPDDLKDTLYRVKRTEHYPLEEFYNRVTLRLDIGFPQGVMQARTALSVLQEGITIGEIEDILNQLPERFDEVFGAKPKGPTSPTSKSPKEPHARPTENENMG